MIRILIADDSPTYRAFLSRVFRQDREIVVVGEAGTAAEAVRQAGVLRPDVITLDLHMPGGGIGVIRAILENGPAAIVLLSAAVQRGSRALTMEALDAGAVDVLPKMADEVIAGETLRRTVRAVARAPVRARSQAAAPRAQAAPSAFRAAVIGVAASTGGPPVVASILRSLPATFRTPLLVVQHLPPGMEPEFARWLDHETSLAVRVPEDGEGLAAGTVYVAGAHHHMTVRGRAIRLTTAPLEAGFRPSATVLFRSMAATLGAAAAGVVLTGMGEDGADGLVAIRQAGGFTAAQAEAECAVYGMPRSAVARGGVTAVLGLGEIASALTSLAPAEIP